MGDLKAINCHNCKNLFEAISIGVCEKTEHKVKWAGDEFVAETCKFYENKYYKKLN